MILSMCLEARWGALLNLDNDIGVVCIQSCYTPTCGRKSCDELRNNESKYCFHMNGLVALCVSMCS